MRDVMRLSDMLRIIPITLAISFASALQAEECKGHVFFYNLEEHQSDVEADFTYFYDKMYPWFEEQGISTSIHTTTPLQSDTCFESNVGVPSEKLSLSLGYVLLKPNNEIRIFGGVMTDMDLVMKANEFFN